MAGDWSNSTDGELICATQTGSLEAFEELVLRYEQRIFRFLAMTSWCEADARELTQDTFVRAYQAIHQCQPRLSFSSWLFAIARRRQIDWFRLARRRPRTEIEPWDLTTGENPADTLADREAGERVWLLAKARLSPAQFEVLWLKYVEEMSVAQIAAAVRKSSSHVKILLFRARRELAKTFKATPPRAETSRGPIVGSRFPGIPREVL